MIGRDGKARGSGEELLRHQKCLRSGVWIVFDVGQHARHHHNLGWIAL